MAAITLSDDPQERINQILREVGTINASINAFHAVYLVRILQIGLGHPKFVDADSPPIQQVKKFGKRLTDALKHPQLIEELNQGWEGIDAVHDRIADLKSDGALQPLPPVPSTVKELQKLAKIAGVKRFSRMPKAKLIEALFTLPEAQLIEARRIYSDARKSC